ncbi:MAG: hypothetical protein ACRC3Y_02355 [Romboutsia sp.]|uniref:hypothetical protein n=1 Tax=Romboutsia sp. TaxID=1965302 RepID=UPI003F3EBCC5
MKKTIIFILSIGLFISILYNIKLKNESETPTDIALSLNDSLGRKDYKNIEKLFMDSNITTSKDELDEFFELSKQNSNYSLFETITYNNGEMLLVEFSPYKINNEYKIIGIKKIPNDMKNLFN